MWGMKEDQSRGVGRMRKYGLLFCLCVGILFVWRYDGAIWELLLYIHMIFIFFVIVVHGFLLYGELLCACFFSGLRIASLSTEKACV